MTPSCGTSSRPGFPRWLGKSEIGKSIRRRSLKDGPARRNPLNPPRIAHMHIMSISLRYAPPKGAIGAEFSGKKLNPKESVLEHYKKYIAEQFETTWEELQ